MITYGKLFRLLDERGLTYSDVGLLAFEYDSLVAGDDVSMEVIERLCAALQVQPGDIMEVSLDI